MVQPTHARHGHNRALSCRPLLDGSTSGSVFPQSIVNSILVIVAEVFTNQSTEGSIVEHDHMIQQFPPTAPHPTFGDTLLARAAMGSSDRLAARGFHHFRQRRNPRRCQPTTVSGFTTTRTSVYLNHSRPSASQNSRSQRPNLGRGLLPLNTPTCCRKATSSRPRSLRAPRNVPTQQKRLNKNRKIGPVHITGGDDRQGGRPLDKLLVLRAD